MTDLRLKILSESGYWAALAPLINGKEVDSEVEHGESIRSGIQQPYQ